MQLNNHICELTHHISARFLMLQMMWPHWMPASAWWEGWYSSTAGRNGTASFRGTGTLTHLWICSLGAWVLVWCVLGKQGSLLICVKEAHSQHCLVCLPCVPILPRPLPCWVEVFYFTLSRFFSKMTKLVSTNLMIKLSAIACYE